MTLQIAAITNSIAALVVPGVQMLRPEEIKTAITDRDTPCLYPEPVGFVSNFLVRHATFDSGASAPKTAEYDLTYTFCYAPVGSSRSLLDIYNRMVIAAFALLDAIIASDALTGAVDFQPKNVLYFGLVSDPSGGRHHGCQMVFHVKEFVN